MKKYFSYVILTINFTITEILQKFSNLSVYKV